MTDPLQGQAAGPFAHGKEFFPVAQFNPATLKQKFGLFAHTHTRILPLVQLNPATLKQKWGRGWNEIIPGVGEPGKFCQV